MELNMNMIGTCGGYILNTNEALTVEFLLQNTIPRKATKNFLYLNVFLFNSENTCMLVMGMTADCGGETVTVS